MVAQEVAAIGNEDNIGPALMVVRKSYSTSFRHRNVNIVKKEHPIARIVYTVRAMRCPLIYGIADLIFAKISFLPFDLNEIPRIRYNKLRKLKK